MTGHGNRCQCRCRTCKQLPEGFKLLHPSTRKRHLAAEAKADSKFRTSASPSLLPSTPPLSPPSSPLHHSSRSEHLHSPSQHGEVPLVAPSDDSSKLSSTACCSNACPMEAVRREAVKEAVAIRTSGHREGEIQGKSTYQAVKQDDIVDTIIWIIISIIALLYCDSRLSRELASKLLSVGSAILDSLGKLPSLRKFLPPSASPRYPSLFPVDIRTALKHLNVEPVLEQQICCPKCFALYPISRSRPTCSARSAPRSRPCHSRLRHPSGQPIRLFSAQRIDTWLAERLANPAFEEALQPRSFQGISSVSDIQQSRFWKNFRDGEGKEFFVGDGKLGFSLYVDWFNPLGNKAGGKSLSFGTIALFCLNLPLSLRLKPENIFLYTVTPGPHEPSTTQLNHLLRSLVDDLLRFWSPGVKLPTASSPEGRLFRAALINLVADLPAARKTAGFASHAANLFCSWCFLSKADIGNLDPHSWERRHRQAHLEAERIWLDAQTQTARGRCLTATGVRWSILNELPYWDATRMVILDIMHNLSGVMQCHAMEIFGFGGDMKRFAKKKAEREADDESESSEGESSEEQTEEEEAGSEEWERERKGLVEESVMVNRKGISLKLGRSKIESTLLPSPSFANTSFPLDDESEDDTFPAPRSHLSQFSLATLRSTISSTSIPSWIDRPPTNLGEPSHGKIKSDTWFKLYQIFIPLAACQVWQPRSDGQLENLFALVCAINLTSSHTGCRSEGGRKGGRGCRTVRE